MGELLWSCDRYKRLLRNGHQVRAKVGPLISQAKFDPQILAVEIDSGFRNVQHIGDFFAGFAVFDQSGDLHLLGGQQYLGVCEEKIGVVPCGVNLDLFQPQDKQAARKQLGFDLEDLILLYVGRFDPLKGIEGLLEAVSHLKRLRRLRLVLVGGDGDEAPESRLLKQKATNLGIDDKVLFAGRVDQKYLPPYYSSADVLVISSHYESFGLVGLEALACGRPVVSTPVGAMETLIKQSQAGHILRDRLPRSLAMGILSIITNPNPPRSNEIRKAVLKYSWSNVAAAILREYETVIGQRVFENDRLVPARALSG